MLQKLRSNPSNGAINRGICPAEIHLFDLLATAKVAELRGDFTLAEHRRARAKHVSDNILLDPAASEGILYFSAKVLEEFSEFNQAVKCIEKYLKLRPQALN